MGADLDMLVVENCVMHKHSQNPALRSAGASAFAPD
jgi:hypothetical protein